MWATILSGLCFCGWASALVILTWGTRRVLRAADLEPADTNETPRVSVIVAARDEAAAISPAIESLLALDWPDLEVVAVDDRSGDGTGQLLDELARRDPRLRVLHVTELPGGWLGKTHALWVGSRQATGQWLLFTDADVHFHPGALRRAVSHASRAGLDQLTLIPDLISGSLFNEILYNAFGMAMWIGAYLDQIESADSEAFMGIGAFNLVRRSTWRKTGGFEAIRMEIADDMGVGMLINQAGGRCRAAVGPDAVQLEWYPSARATIRGLRKNAFAVMCGFSFWRAAAISAAIILTVLGPLMAFATDVGWVQLLAGLALAMPVSNAAAISRRWHRRFWPAVFAPVGQLMIVWAIIGSALHYWRNAGVDWRGTHYRLEELRRNQKVHI